MVAITPAIERKKEGMMGRAAYLQHHAEACNLSAILDDDIIDLSAWQRELIEEAEKAARVRRDITEQEMEEIRREVRNIFSSTVKKAVETLRKCPYLE